MGERLPVRARARVRGPSHDPSRVRRLILRFVGRMAKIVDILREGTSYVVRVLPAETPDEEAEVVLPARCELRAARPVVRLRHLRRRRHRHASAPTTSSSRINHETTMTGDGAPHLRRPHAGRARRDRDPLPRRGHREHPRARRRPAQGPRAAAGRAAARDRAGRPRSRRSATSRSASPRTPSHIRASPTLADDRRTPPRSSRWPTSRSRSSSSTPTHYFDPRRLDAGARRRQAGDPRASCRSTSLASIEADVRDARGRSSPRGWSRKLHAVGRRPAGRAARSASTRPPSSAASCSPAARPVALLHAQPVDRDPRDLRAARVGRATVSAADLH